jgi:hypothetical protein
MSGTRNNIPILFYRRQVVTVVPNRYRALSKNKDEKNLTAFQDGDLPFTRKVDICILDFYCCTVHFDNI